MTKSIKTKNTRPSKTSAKHLAAESPCITWQFNVIIPYPHSRADAFLADMQEALPALKHVKTSAVCDSFAGSSVLLETCLQPRSTMHHTTVSEVSKLAELYCGELWYCQPAPAVSPAEITEAPDTASRQYRMRVETVTEAIVLRMALGPWVQSWAESGQLFLATNGAKASLDALDREIRFEVTEDAPLLDALRWYIAQVPDMLVAATSLDTAAAYDGICLPPTLLFHMQPAPRTVQAMRNTVQTLTEAFELNDGPLVELEETLSDILGGFDRFGRFGGVCQ